ncbi:MAG: hypothetical protein ABFS34_00705 [Gemmatimonadota bacterium]
MKTKTQDRCPRSAFKIMALLALPFLAGSGLATAHQLGGETERTEVTSPHAPVATAPALRADIG